MTYYIAYLHQDQGTDIGVSFPDFPGCITAGKDLDEAMSNAKEALEFHIEALLEDGEAISEPSTLQALNGDPDAAGATKVMVEVNVGDPIVKANITLKRSQLEMIDNAARASGLTRSAYLIHSGIVNSGRSGEFQKTVETRAGRGPGQRRRPHVE